MSSQRIGTFEQLLATLYVDIHPPLFVTWMHLWGRLFGDGELALRLPSLLSGLAAIPLLFWTGHRLVGSTAARWATVLLALSPAHIWYSAEARLYAPMVASSLLAFGTFDRLLDPNAGRRRGLFWLHVGVVAAMLSLHYYLALFVVAQAVVAPIVARGFSPAVRRLMVAHGVGILLLGGFVAAKRALGEFETSQDYLGALTGERMLAFLDWCWTGNTLLPAASPVLHTVAHVGQGLGACLIGLGLVRLSATMRQLPRGWLVLVGLFTLPLFLFGCALLGFDRTYIERTMIAALPFVLLLAGNGLALLPRGLHRVFGVATIVFASAALAGLFAHYRTHWTVYKPNSDWRAAAAWLGREIDGDGAGRAVFTSTPNPRPLSYYDPRIQSVKNLELPATPEKLGAAVEKRLGSWLGGFAERTFRAFADTNQALLAGAKLRVYRSRSDLGQLDLATRGKDDICYLVQDLWHPHRSVDSSVWDLLANPRVQVLDHAEFSGIAVHKVRILP